MNHERLKYLSSVFQDKDALNSLVKIERRKSETVKWPYGNRMSLRLKLDRGQGYAAHLTFTIWGSPWSRIINTSGDGKGNGMYNTAANAGDSEAIKNLHRIGKRYSGDSKKFLSLSENYGINSVMGNYLPGGAGGGDGAGVYYYGSVRGSGRGEYHNLTPFYGFYSRYGKLPEHTVNLRHFSGDGTGDAAASVLWGGYKKGYRHLLAKV